MSNNMGSICLDNQPIKAMTWYKGDANCEKCGNICLAKNVSKSAFISYCSKMPCSKLETLPSGDLFCQPDES